MWVAEVRIDGGESLLGSRTKKFNVSLSGYPFSFHEKEDGVYIFFAGFLFGEEKNIKGFFKDLKKDQRVLSLELDKNFLIGHLREPPKYRPIHEPNIIRVKPIIIKEDGSEIWTIGSLKKKSILDFISLYEKTHKGRLIRITNEEVSDFSIIGFYPKITKKQKGALETALKHGYYEYPRKTDLIELAKLLGVSYSTYQAHLRKAERSIIPFFFGRCP
jgi:hypothetical protein